MPYEFHWVEEKPALRVNNKTSRCPYKDPTADKAIANVMRQRKSSRSVRVHREDPLVCGEYTGNCLAFLPLGLIPGEEIIIHSKGFFQEVSAERVEVMKEEKYYITVRCFFHSDDLSRSYVTTLNKPSIFCGDLWVSRKSTMEDLRGILLKGGALNTADFVSYRKE